MQNGDIFIVYVENTPEMFGVVCDITPDVKADWWIFTFQPLALAGNDKGPTDKLVDKISWILREPYFSGSIFTMGGRSMYLKKIDIENEKPVATEKKPNKAQKKDGKVIRVTFSKKEIENEMDNEIA